MRPRATAGDFRRRAEDDVAYETCVQMLVSMIVPHSRYATTDNNEHNALRRVSKSQNYD